MVHRVATAVLSRVKFDEGSRLWRWLIQGETVVVTLLCISVDVFVWDLARQHQAPLGLAASTHGTVVLVLALWLWSRSRRGIATPIDVLFSITIAFLGPIGAACAILTTLMMTVYRRTSCSFEEWYKSLIPDVSQSQAKQLCKLIRSKRERSTGSMLVRPFTDVLTQGTGDQKQTVIALLARNFKPPLAATLGMALADTDPTIRIQAATATAAIERRYLEKWIRLQAEVEKAPGDYQAHFSLANHLDDYAYAGILDDTRADDIRERARKIYLNCLQLDDTVQEVHFVLGRLLLRSGDPDGASELFANLVSSNADSCGEVSAQALSYYAECLYLLGCYSELRSTFAKVNSSSKSSFELQEKLLSMAKFWNGNTTSMKTSKVE